MRCLRIRKKNRKNIFFSLPEKGTIKKIENFISNIKKRHNIRLCRNQSRFFFGKIFFFEQGSRKRFVIQIPLCQMISQSIQRFGNLFVFDPFA